MLQDKKDDVGTSQDQQQDQSIANPMEKDEILFEQAQEKINNFVPS